MRLLPWLSDGALDALQANVAFALLGLSVLCLPRAYRRVLAVWRPAPAPERAALAGALAVAAVLRWLIAPHWIVTVYIGYHLTQQAIDLLPVSHYGVGASALYHALFAFFPRDHATLLWANSILGVATLPLVATFARRYFDDARAGIIAAALLAALPLFLKNDNSDANHVPCLWWLYGALVLWDEYLETRAAEPLAFATVLAVLAAIARPEMPVLLPAVLALIALGQWPPRTVWRDRRLYLAAAVALLALVPQIEHVLREIDSLQRSASLPGLGPRRVEEFFLRLRTLNTLITPSLFPRVLLWVAAVGLLLPGGRHRARWALALAAIPAWLIYSLDLCRANMARVHVPSAQLVALVAAAGLSRLLDLLPSRSARVLLGVGFVGALYPDAAASVRVLWAPTNEQAEEAFVREAIRRLPSGRLTFVRMGHGDRAIVPGRSEYTHDHFPDYLITPPAGEARTRTLREWIEHPDWSAPVFFYSGTRCFARMRPPSARVPRGDNHQEACQEMHDRFALEPVYRRAVPNRGDVWLEYYGDARTLPLTLFRVRPRPVAAAGPTAAAAAVIDAQAPPSRLGVFVIGGAGMVRRGAPVRLRVVRSRARDGLVVDVDVTAAAAVRVDPPGRGEVDPAGVFLGRTTGRAALLATLDGEAAQTLVEVSDELPPGVDGMPTIRASGGLVARSVELDARPDGTVSMRVEFENETLAVEGRRRGRSFPVTVPVRAGDPRSRFDARSSPAGAFDVAGVIILDRWVAGRLDGHAALQAGPRSLQLRFTVLLSDPGVLTAPVAAERLAR